MTAEQASRVIMTPRLLRACVVEDDTSFITAPAGVQILSGVHPVHTAGSNVNEMHPSFDRVSFGVMRLPG